MVGAWMTELEVNDHPLLSVSHDTVRPTFDDVTFIVNAEDGTLVEERPAAAEPIGHLGMRQSAAKHGGDELNGERAIVNEALRFKFVQGIIDVSRGADGREHPVQYVTQLDIVGITLLVISADEVMTLVALAELSLGDTRLDVNRYGL